MADLPAALFLFGVLVMVAASAVLCRRAWLSERGRVRRRDCRLFMPHSPDPDAALWRARVRRLAGLMALGRPETSEDFDTRRCLACGREVAVNRGIYPAGEPFCCGDSLYDPSAPGRRDGYWWACAVAGRDPEAAHGAPLSRERRAFLAGECLAFGLVFGEMAGGLRHDVGGG